MAVYDSPTLIGYSDGPEDWVEFCYFSLEFSTSFPDPFPLTAAYFDAGPLNYYLVVGN
jgi:hypothetical protein